MGESQEDIKGANMLGCEISEDMRDPLRPILQMCKWHHPDETLLSNLYICFLIL